MTCPPPQPTKPTPTHPHQHCGCPCLSASPQLVNTTKGRGGHQICSLPVAYYGTSRIMYKVIWDPTWVPSIYSRKGGSAIPARAYQRQCVFAASLHRRFPFRLFRAFACSMLCICPHSDPPAPAAPWLRRSISKQLSTARKARNGKGVGGRRACTRSLTARRCCEERRKASVLVITDCVYCTL